MTPLDDGTVEVVAPGYGQTAQPGTHRLPFASVLIAIPPGAVHRLGLSSVEETVQQLPAPIATAPQPEGTIQDRQGRPIGGAFAATTPANPDYPASAVTFEELGNARGVRLARLTFYPARPDGDRLRVTHHLVAELQWVGRTGTPARSSSTPAQSDPMLELVRRQVLNPWDVAAVGQPTGFKPTLQASASEGPTSLIEVEQPGLYRVTYGDLAGLGFASATPQNLRLERGSDEVAYEWEGDADAIFEPGEALVFYAEHRFSRWTPTDVYRLVGGSTPGQRMQSRSATPTGLPTGVPWVEQEFEENHIYTPDCFCGSLSPGRDGDRWVWEMVRRPDLASQSFPFQVQAPDAGQPATLTVWLIGYTDVAANPDHRVSITVNSVPVGQMEWNGKRAASAEFSLPAGVLRNGQNQLVLTLLGMPGVSVEGAWLDGFAIRYGRGLEAAGDSVRFGVAETPSEAPGPPLPRQIYLPLVVRQALPTGQARAYAVSLDSPGPYRAYAVTDPLHPQRLSGIQVNGSTVTVGDPVGGTPRRYVVASASAILQPARVRAEEQLVGSGAVPTGADALIITHPAFAGALAPLVSLRQSQGLATVLINVSGIHDTYGDGRPDPEAIQAFIADAYANWNPRPSYVLLVGDGSFDPRRYQAGSPVTFIPPYLADVDPWAGETAADNRYACVDGLDAIPDLFIGRLPVQTLAQAQTMVNKIILYETTPAPGDWHTGMSLFADDADAGGDFPASSETYAATHVSAPFNASRHYCGGSNPYASDCPAGDADGLHAAALDDWNGGALVIQFTGHASWQQWAAERFFHLDDLGSLYNGQRLPMVVEMSCFTGAFQRPEPTLDEELVTLPGGGAIAAWGSTGLGVGTGHDYLSDGFFRTVFDRGIGTVGEAIQAGKLALVANGQHLDLVDTFTLLGDPATQLDLEVLTLPNQVFLPLTLRGR